MESPRIKKFYQVYEIEGSSSIFIGVGPEKFEIEDPTPDMKNFLAVLDGTLSLAKLRERFSNADEWISDLKSMNVLEDASSLENIEDAYIAKRWDRQISHLRLYDRPGWSGIKAQERLSKSRVVVIGIGAGGSTLLRFLSAVGIGNIEAVDFDTFALDNLATHTTLDEEDVGQLKTETVKKHLFKQNSKLNFKIHNKKIESKEELADMVAGADFFLQAFDRPRLKAALWSAWASAKTKVPMSSIGANDKGARVGPITIPGKTACPNCIGIYEQKWLQPSEIAALMGTNVAVQAGLMVSEIVKVITDSAESRLLGRSLFINTESLEFNFNDHPINKNCFCQDLSKYVEKF